LTCRLFFLHFFIAIYHLQFGGGFFCNAVSLEIVSQLLGHSSISITADSYWKVVKGK